MFGHQNNGQNDQGAGQLPPPPQHLLNDDQHEEAFNPALPSHTMPFNDVIAPATPTPPADNHQDKPGDDSGAPKLSDVSNDLLDIKQQALNQLSPLVSHLDQTPEEKFRTTMMMIQATDNQDLVKDAYAAAQSITDEKAKAQALLDIVNEINYFTQHHQA